MTVLAVFRSRSQSMDYAQKLMEYGVPAETVPAPKEARIGCGLCVRFDGRVFVRAQAVLRLGKYSSFKGFYRQDYVGGILTLYPLNGL
jgi:hypothetical protein